MLSVSRSTIQSKCDQYFPLEQGQSLTFDSIVVQVISIEHRTDANLEIRHLLVKDVSVLAFRIPLSFSTLNDDRRITTNIVSIITISLDGQTSVLLIQTDCWI